MRSFEQESVKLLVYEIISIFLKHAVDKIFYTSIQIYYIREVVEKFFAYQEAKFFFFLWKFKKILFNFRKVKETWKTTCQMYWIAGWICGMECTFHGFRLFLWLGREFFTFSVGLHSCCWLFKLDRNKLEVRPVQFASFPLWETWIYFSHQL